MAALDNEKGVIGCILIDNDSITKIYKQINPNMFKHKFSRSVIKTIYQLYDSAESITLVNLCPKLESEEISREAVLAYLKDCISMAEYSTNIRHFADNVENEYRVAIFKQIYDSSDLSPDNITTSIARAIIELQALTENRRSNVKSMAELVRSVKGNYFKPQITDGAKFYGSSSLCKAMGVLKPGNVYIVAARPAVGKSALAMNVVMKNAERGIKTGYFNLEMGEDELYERFFSRVSGNIDMETLRTATEYESDSQERDFESTNKELEDLPITISTGSKTVMDIYNESKNMDFGLIVVDYLQLITPEKVTSSRTNDVGTISRGLKSIADRLHCPIIALAQLNRAVDGRADREPEMGDLRESGDIEADASGIILLWNLNEKDSEFKGAKLAKNRQGKKIRIALRFDGGRMNFLEASDTIETIKRSLENKQYNVDKMNREIDDIRKEYGSQDDYMDTSHTSDCPFT